MGLFKRVSSWFAGSNGHQNGHAPPSLDDATQPGPDAILSAPALSRTVTIDLPDFLEPDERESDGAPIVESKAPASGLSSFAPADDVATLVRRVDERLAQLEQRGRRLIEIAERVPDAMGVLPTLCAQNAELIEAAHQMVSEARTGADRLDASLVRLASQGERSAERMDTSEKVHAELVEALAEFRSVMGRFAEEASAREHDLMGLVASSRKWVVGALAIGAAAGIAVLALAAIQFFTV